MAFKPFESAVQDLVYNMDVGVGLRLIKVGLYLIALLLLMLIYTATQFHGLREAEAMECAQLGRNLAYQHRLVTQCIRPSSLWYLATHARSRDPQINRQPDIITPPLYPALLAAAFRLTGISLAAGTSPGVFKPEQYIIIPICHLFTLATGVLVWLLGRRLFDRRVGFLGVTAYFLSDAIWGMSVTGTSLSLATFLVTAACYAAVVAVMNRQAEKRRRAWLIPLAVCALCCILAFLTRYGTAVLVPALALYFGLSLGRRRWVWAGVFVVAFLVGIAPWLARNVLVSGGPLGLAPYLALNQTNLFEGDQFERAVNPQLSVGKVVDALQNKWIVNFAGVYRGGLRTIGDGLFICLFLTAFLHRFVRPHVHRLRWCVALALLLLVGVGCFFGDVSLRLLQTFWPLVLLYGLAFFLVLLERLQLQIRLFSLAITLLIMVLGALPLILTLLPPRAAIPYPPYYPPFVVNISQMLGRDEMICTDMPWATAWYGNRNSLLLPATIDGFYEINDYRKRISAIYFTTLTRDKPWVRALMTGPDRTWYPILEGRIPSDFPLGQGFPLNNLDQLFLTDRERWSKRQ